MIKDFNINSLSNTFQLTTLQNYINKQSSKVQPLIMQKIDHIWTNASTQQCHVGSTQVYWTNHKPIYTFQLTTLQNYINKQSSKVQPLIMQKIDHIWTNASTQQCHVRSTQVYWTNHKPIHLHSNYRSSIYLTIYSTYNQKENKTSITCKHLHFSLFNPLTGKAHHVCDTLLS
jgi:hypothetical protein